MDEFMSQQDINSSIKQSISIVIDVKEIGKR